MPNPETHCVRWKKITLVGVGLLGGSLGMALRKRRLAGSVAGFVRRPASVVECEQLGAVTQATLDLQHAVAGAELIVLCTPIAQMRGLVEQMLPALKRGAIVTDVGSVKGSVVRDLEALVARAGAPPAGRSDNPKGELQELAQQEYQCAPRYERLAVEGPAHAPSYRARVSVQGHAATGEGPTRRAAEAAAAVQLLAKLRG